MILSMTGYGDAEATLGGVDVAVEIRSVNNRYFKAVIKLPEQLQAFENEIESLLRAELGRGSVNFQLRTRGDDELSPNDIDSKVLSRYVDLIGPLTRPPGVVLDLAALLDLPGVCVPAPLTDERRRELWTRVESLTAEALSKVVTMRRDEGQALAADLQNHAAQLRHLAQTISQRAPEVIKDYQQRLLTRVNQLLAEAQLKLDEDSLLREIAIFADRCDISEELARIASHLDQFDELCQSGEAAGRKLDFVAQELLREVNTIGSKANDSMIARHVVDMKSCIDRIKEQVQNVA